MRRAGIAVVALCSLGAVQIARGALWIGEGSTSGPVVPPPSYGRAVASLELDRHDFDHLVPGTAVSDHDLGGFRLATDSGGAMVVARSGLVADAQPASSPIALLAVASGGGETPLDMAMASPVASVGFALMGLESRAWITVFGEEGAAAGAYLIPPGLPGERRWIGISMDGRDVWGVRVEPMGVGDYAIDDVELGRHLPEPTTLLMGSCLAVLWRRRARQPRPTKALSPRDHDLKEPRASARAEVGHE